jgi:hypothetical protein
MQLLILYSTPDAPFVIPSGRRAEGETGVEGPAGAGEAPPAAAQYLPSILPI